MIIYVACTLLSAAIAYSAFRLQTRYKIITAILIALPFCLVAAFRDISVGTDTSLYPWFAYRASLSNSLIGLFGNDGGTTEPLFLLAVWFVTKAFRSFSAVLFLIEALIVFPVVIALQREAPKYTWMGLVIYGLVYFGFSLNLMRQMIGMAFVLLAFSFARGGKMGYSLMICLVGCGFHSTAIFGFPILLYYCVLIRGRSKDASHQAKGAFVLATLACIAIIGLAFVFGVQLLVVLSSLKESFSYQIDHMGSGDSSVSILIYGIAPFVLGLFEKARADWRYRADVLFLQFVVCLGGVTAQFSLISPELTRIGLFFHFFSVLLYPKLLTGRTRTGFALVTAGGVGLAVALFYLMYVKGGACEVIPYSFAQLKL